MDQILRPLNCAPIQKNYYKGGVHEIFSKQSKHEVRIKQICLISANVFNKTSTMTLKCLK